MVSKVMLLNTLELLAACSVASASLEQQNLDPFNLNCQTTEHLQISAVVHEETWPHAAKIECWELNSALQPYPTIGSAFLLSNTTNITYVSLPPRSLEGLHHPPHPMLFILLSGVAHVGLPGDPSSGGLWIAEGVNPVIVATDTLGVGHFTYYPSEKETVALQAPFQDGMVPKHRVIADRACSDSHDPADLTAWVQEQQLSSS